ncbi:YciI family protein [Streptomyces sp. NPDC007084]|uniref:YciI family protein n=1 Tax=Streptomyces sp. NPDC007084 TaxID=3154313 RepID=UPI0034562B07
MDTHQDASAHTSSSADRLLGQDYWLVWSTPNEGVTADQVTEFVDEHLEWLLGLEREGVVLCSGPLLSGPGTAPGSGVTVLRADDEESARARASADPFVVHGLRTFTLHRWRLNEGSLQVRIMLGARTFEWK